jgi:hypothetical protein
MEPEGQSSRAYWRARTIEVVAYGIAGLVVMAPALLDALQHEPLASWVQRLKGCEGCRQRRARLRRFVRDYDAAEGATVAEARRVVEREERRRGAE